MPDQLPDVSGLLALLKKFQTTKWSGLPGGFATEEEIAFAQKDSPIKGERRALERKELQKSPFRSLRNRHELLSCPSASTDEKTIAFPRSLTC
ncbi:hypothetical protein FPANT_12420 [Fusarium pseudoanthophilum]|uniref:Uncharacterized protein n=1 Tax=Fusarium pseudoanthophilum TaxID=48495 RepID=A0A8H5KGE8_9HYPO|nr:hypothetical protein FPANT_12420 [Fusarium pseudoanthophilum]